MFCDLVLAQVFLASLYCGLAYTAGKQVTMTIYFGPWSVCLPALVLTAAFYRAEFPFCKVLEGFKLRDLASAKWFMALNTEFLFWVETQV